MKILKYLLGIFITGIYQGLLKLLCLCIGGKCTRIRLQIALIYIQGWAERMRQITTFVVLFQVIWDIPSQVFTMNASCLQ